MADQSSSLIRAAALQGLELGENLLDRVQTRAVGRQVEDRHALAVGVGLIRRPAQTS
jgi:hypothetical protein